MDEINQTPEEETVTEPTPVTEPETETVPEATEEAAPATEEAA